MNIAGVAQMAERPHPAVAIATQRGVPTGARRPRVGNTSSRTSKRFVAGSIPATGAGPRLTSPVRRRRQNPSGAARARRVAGTGQQQWLPGSRGPWLGLRGTRAPQRATYGRNAVPGSIPGNRSRLRCLVCEDYIGNHCQNCMVCP